MSGSNALNTLAGTMGITGGGAGTGGGATGIRDEDEEEGENEEDTGERELSGVGVIGVVGVTGRGTGIEIGVREELLRGITTSAGESGPNVKVRQKSDYIKIK